ncbi:MAG: hypothetical protein ACREEM_14880 [Blastocatellia bacterium]
MVLTLQFSLHAQQVAKAGDGGPPRDAAIAQYNYLFENPRFTTPVQEVKFDDRGQGEYRFKRKDQDEIVLKLDLSNALVSQVRSLFGELNFLSSDENYQHKKDFSHLGTMTITCVRDGKERAVKFNYTENQALNRLADIFRNIATQETRVFELDTIRQNDPISTPAQLRLLEGELKGKHIADPDRFTPILQEIKLDEGVPLIARNHADRLLLTIKKGK